MDILTDVSETALITLKARVVEASKAQPVLEDEIGKKCLERILALFPAGTRPRVLDGKLPASLTRYIALRARHYDAHTRTFIAERPAGLVVSLGCGFDTRYWRLSDRAWPYVEIDLPEVIALKTRLLGDIAPYRMIGGSVLEERWLEEIRSIQTEHILFLAEGLLMYLPKPQVRHLFKKLADTFSTSQIVFEVTHDKYTRGIWKKSVESKMRRSLGSTAGASYQFGVKEAREIETYGQGIKVVEEWSYFEDEDIIPRFLKLFRHFKFLTRTQWTIKATLNQ